MCNQFRSEREGPSTTEVVPGNDNQVSSGSINPLSSAFGKFTETVESFETLSPCTSSAGGIFPSTAVTPFSEGQTDLGLIIQEAKGTWDKLRSLVRELSDDKRKQYLSCHFKPAPSDTLHCHPVTNGGKTWKNSFQMQWLQQFAWLSYSPMLSGGICRYCILFPEHPSSGERLGCNDRSGVLVLSPYKSLLRH